MNPNMYGKHLAKIPLATPPQSMKVYNKVVHNGVDSSSLFISPTASSTVITDSQATVVTKTVQVSVPTFYKQSHIKMSHRSALLRSNDGSTDVIYGQGEMVLPIDPSDNFVKFTVYEADQKDQSRQTFANLNNNSKFNINFGTDASISIGSIGDASVENPSKGQIAFRIPKNTAKKILQTTDKLMFITLIAEDGTETVMYTGKWESSSNYAQILSAADAAKNAMLNDPQVIISGLNQTISQLQSALEIANGKVSGQRISQSYAVSETFQNINAMATKVPNSLASALVNESTTVKAIDIENSVAPSVTRRTGLRGSTQSIS
jgi:hypothetical protein